MNIKLCADSREPPSVGGGPGDRQRLHRLPHLLLRHLHQHGQLQGLRRHQVCPEPRRGQAGGNSQGQNWDC